MLLSILPTFLTNNGSHHRNRNYGLWLRRYRKLLQPLTSIANFTASSFNKYESGIGIMQTKKSKRAKIRSTHSPPCWIWKSQYLTSAIDPPINSSAQDIAAIWMPIVFLLRLLILDSSDKHAKTVSLHSDLTVYESKLLILISSVIEYQWVRWL